MRFSNSAVWPLLLVLWLCVPHALCEQQRVLLVSIDGFRWDYFRKAPTPNLDRLAAQGIKAKALVPVFPTETFPSHYSMLTGLHPESHGIIRNTMRDPAISGLFSLADRETMQNTNWWLGEPIWITAQRQGLRSATCFWPGTDVLIGGVRPTYWLPFDNEMPIEKRIEHICQWLALPEDKRPHFLTLYLGDLDKAGHRHGPDSPEVVQAVKEADEWIGVLVRRLEGMPSLNLNVIITSDHGMTAVSPDRVVVIDDYADMGEIMESRGGELVFIHPKPGREEVVLQQLERAPHVRFYARQNLPERLHFRKSPRIAPIVGLPEEGWVVLPRAFTAQWRARGQRGSHGYDNAYSSMRGIFIAQGPALKQGLVVEPFLNLQVYHLVMQILGVKPGDGDIDRELLLPMLIEPSSRK